MNSSSEIIDISPKINPQLAVFPGDTEYSRSIDMSFDQGDHLGLSHINTTLHLGAHVDAPNHYSAQGEGIDKRSLDYYLGPCQVIELEKKKTGRIHCSEIDWDAVQAPRILFKTESFPNPYRWQNNFRSLSAELISKLAEKKISLVGIDTPSIDPADDKILESHQSVYQYKMAILEGIVLTHVEPGFYTLVALPLPLEGADASPVRAVLLRHK